MRKVKLKKEQYLRRRRRSKKPFPVKGEYRLCIFKSAKHIEAQIIDDFNQTTLVAASSKEKAFSKEKVNKSELASLVGKSLSERAKAKKLKKYTLIEMVSGIMEEWNLSQKLLEKVD